MQKTQIKDAVRNIRKKIISFLSICLIVMLGVGGYLTTGYIYNSMVRQTEDYYKAQHFSDFRLTSSLGFSQDEIDEVKSVKGISDAEGVQIMTGSLNFDSDAREVEVITMTERVSVPKLIKGKLPEKPEECLISKSLANKMKLGIGDHFNLSINTEGIDPAVLKVNEFTVTGIMYHPEYVRTSPECPVAIQPAAFDSEKLGDAFLNVLVKGGKALDKDMFDKSYADAAASVRKELEKATSDIEAEQTQRVRDEANKKIDEEWEKAEAELTAAEEEINAKEAELEDALTKAKSEIANGYNQLSASAAQLKAGERELNNKTAMLANAKNSVASYDSNVSSMSEEQLAEYFNSSGPFIAQYAKAFGAYVNQAEVAGIAASCAQMAEDGNSAGAISTARSYINNKIAAAESDVYAARQKINNGWAQYNSGKQKLQQAESELASKEAEGRSQIKEAREELSSKTEEAKSKTEEARKEANEIESKLVILDRPANESYLDIYSTMNSIKAVGPAFGILFLIVGAMVTFSTLVIIIDEQKKLVGTTKAFGFHGNEILGKYLIFGISAAVIGVLAGVLLGIFLSRVGLHAILGTNIYIFDVPPTKITPLPTLLISIGAVILVIIVTMFACTDLLKSPASLLMQGDTVKSKKQRENAGLAKHHSGSLLSALILRNMRKERARVIMFIAIIAGSCILIGTGFTLKFAIDKMPGKQMQDVIAYDLRVDLGPNVSDEDRAAIESKLNEKNVSFVNTCLENHLYRIKGREEALQILALDAKDTDKVYKLTDPDTGKQVALPDDGILIQRRLHEYHDINKGDTMSLYDDEIFLHKTTVKGIVQNYFGRTVITSRAGYENIFGKQPKDNTLYLSLGKADGDALIEELSDMSGDLTFEYSDEFVTKFESLSRMIDIVVVMLTSIAILMSFLILLNLTNIFVSRRKKEIIIMRVNGFRHKEALQYLTHETIFNTVIGLVIGVLIGCLSGGFMVSLVESQDIQFAREINPMSWVLAVAIEALFAVVVSWISFRKVKDFNLKEIAE